MLIRAMIRLSRTTHLEFNKSAEVIRNLSNSVEGLTSAFSFPVLNLTTDGEFDEDKLKEVFKLRQEGRIHRDVVIAIDLLDEVGLQSAMAKINSVLTVSSSEDDILNPGGSVFYSICSTSISNDEVTVSPDEGAQED